MQAIILILIGLLSMSLQAAVVYSCASEKAETPEIQVQVVAEDEQIFAVFTEKNKNFKEVYNLEIIGSAYSGFSANLPRKQLRLLISEKRARNSVVAGFLAHLQITLEKTRKQNLEIILNLDLVCGQQLMNPRPQ